MSIIPLIGRFIADSPGIQAFLEGVIIFRLLSEYAIDQVLTTANVHQVNVYSGFLGIYRVFSYCWDPR